MAEVHERYEFDYSTGTVKLRNRKCPRCGSVLAHHLTPVERWHCGKCGYTDFVQKK